MVPYKQFYNEGFKEKLNFLGLLASLSFATPILSKPAESIFDQLARHEGMRNKMYYDSKGIPTIGIGFNLKDPGNLKILNKLKISERDLRNGLSNNQIKLLFDESLKQAKSDALKFLPNFNQHPVQVQNAIIDMSFNLGHSRLNKFVQLRKALMEKNYDKASKEMLNSTWAKQVGNRAKYLSELVKSASTNKSKSTFSRPS